jgi:hypothetical protein
LTNNTMLWHRQGYFLLDRAFPLIDDWIRGKAPFDTVFLLGRRRTTGKKGAFQ